MAFGLGSIFRLFPLGAQAGGTPPPPPSGWSKEARVALPPPAVQLTGYGLLIDETATELKQTAGGGVLTDANAQDVRFEKVSDASALGWDRLHYDSASGRLVAFVQAGTISASTRFDMRMLAGKSGATEQNMAGAWSGWTAIWTGASGTSREGTTARNLTASGVTTDSADPWVGIYDGTTSKMTHADGSFLNGLSAIRVELWCKADVTGSDRRIVDQGPDDTGNRTHGLMIRHDAAGYRGSASNVWTVNLRIYDGSEYWSVRYESAANVHSTAWQHLVFQWRSGSLPELYIDGQLDSPTWTGRVRETDGSTEPDVAVSGTVQLPTGQLSVGGLGTAPMWDGKIGLVAIRPDFATAERALCEARNRAEPRRGYGISQFVNGSPSNIPVVALPLEGSQVQSATVSYDVAAQAYDPDDTPSLTAAGSVTGTVSSATVNVGKLDVTSGANAGDGTAAFTITGGSTTSSSKVYVEVTGAAGGSEYPAALRTVNVSNSSELAAALASAQPGDHIVLADGTYGGSGFATSAAGTGANPVVIRASNKLLARLTAKLTISHAWHLLWGLDFDDAGLGVDAAAADLVVRRCKARNYSSYQGIWCRVKAPRALFDRCELTMPQSRGISFDVGAGGAAGRVYKCWFHDWGPTASDQTFEPVQAGFGAADTDINGGLIVELCLFENINQNNNERECVSIKSSGNTVKQCHLKDARVVLVRHGNNNRIDGCRLENVTGTKATKVGVFDKSNTVITTVADRIDLFAGDIDADSWGPGSASSLHPASELCKVISCSATLRVGYQESTGYTVKADGNSIEDHTGTVSLLWEQNTTQTGVPSETGLSTITLTAADVGPDAP